MSAGFRTGGAGRQGKLINVALHNTGDLNYLRHIPYSLSFK